MHYLGIRVHFKNDTNIPWQRFVMSLTCIKFHFDVFSSHLKFGKGWNCCFLLSALPPRLVVILLPPPLLLVSNFSLAYKEMNISQILTSSGTLLAVQWTYVVSWIFMVLILMLMSYSIQWLWRRECINNVKEMDEAKLLLLCRPRALLYNLNKDKWKSNKSIRRPFILCTLDILPIGPRFKEACNSSKTNFLLAPHCSGQSS